MWYVNIRNTKGDSVLWDVFSKKEEAVLEREKLIYVHKFSTDDVFID